jgi:hypothetical protein
LLRANLDRESPPMLPETTSADDGTGVEVTNSLFTSHSRTIVSLEFYDFFFADPDDGSLCYPKLHLLMGEGKT